MMMAQPHPRAAWPSNDDMTVFNLIVIALGAGVGSYLLWTHFHAEISAAVIAWRHQEIRVLQIFTDRFDMADAQMRGSNPAGVTLRDLYGISHAIGRTWRLPATVLIVVLGLLCMARNAPSQFRRQFDLNGLIREQATVFTTTAAFVKRQLRLVPPAAGSPRPADYALSPAEWIARNARASDGRFNEAKARRALVAQLGARWTGPEGAAPVVRVMFAAFSLHLVERRDEALALLGACSQSLMDVGSGDAEGPAEPLALPAGCLQEVDALIGEPGGPTAAGLLITDRHAWTHTALMSLLNTARLKAGVLPPAQFAWLKLVDRPLWYALHSLGFETEGVGRYLHPNPRPEAAGARDHWALERVAGRGIDTPKFDQAIDALRWSHARSPSFASGSSNVGPKVTEGQQHEFRRSRGHDRADLHRSRAPRADPEHTRNGPTAGPAA
jgi:intracellular multiplication protein IcmP